MSLSDGVNGDIKATVFDYTNSNPLAVRLTDADGNYVSAGAGTQYTEGDVDATITGTAFLWEDTGDTLRAVSATKPLPVDITDATIAVTQSGTWNIGTLTSITNAVAVTGTFWQDTQPVSGTFWQATQPVSIASVPSHAVTNAGTFAVQVDGNALTSLQLIDDTVYTDGTGTPSKGILIMGSDATNPQAIITDATGHLQVDVLTAPSTAVTNAGTFAVQATLAAETTKVIGTVNVAASQTIAVTNAGTFATQVNDGTETMLVNVDGSISACLVNSTASIGKLAANSGVDIGDVDVTSIAAGDNNIGNVDIASALPAGTAAIGKLLPPDVDVTTNSNYVKKYYTSAGAVTDGIIWSPAAGKRWHIHTIYINVSAAVTVTLEDDLAAGDAAIWKGELAANSGVVMTFPEKYPWASGEDASDLLVTSTAGNIYITVSGMEL